MKAYIKEAAEEFGEDMTKVVMSPGSRWLFTVGKEMLLKKDRLDKFCLIVEKLLWIIQRGRPNCDPTIYFLCIWKKSPDIQD